MVVLIMGPSGSGKTTICRELDKKGCNIIPTYTTREPRPHDDYTVCISKEEFDRKIKDGEFISYSSFNAPRIGGTLYYGIPMIKDDKDSLNVIICAYEYYEDIIKFAGEDVVSIYIDVDDETIIEKSSMDINRGKSINDLMNRLERDREKNEKLKEMSDYIIRNEDMTIDGYTCSIFVIYFCTCSFLRDAAATETCTKKEDWPPTFLYHDKEKGLLHLRY